MTLAAPLTYHRWIALALARAIQADDDQPQGREAHALLGRTSECLGKEHVPWLRALCQALARMTKPQWDRFTTHTLADHLESMHEFFGWAHVRGDGDPDDESEEDPDGEPFPTPRVRRLLLRPARMTARPYALEALELPVWHTLPDLANGLGIDLDMLEVLAGRAHHYRDAVATPLRPHVRATHHYRSLLVPKRREGMRLIEAPMPALKAVQRRLLDVLLARVPVHEAAHGFVTGRNVASHAAAHTGQHWVLRLDLQDFFPSIGRARIAALFRTLGYAEGVADRLTTLCTVRTPVNVRERLRDAGAIDFHGAKRLASPHLPQGAPTSPHLANLCTFSLDLRLEGLAYRFGAHYSRYADDLVFSGSRDTRLAPTALHAWVRTIVEEEGFRLRRDKTRLMRAGGRQTVTGVVVNLKPNLSRPDYDRLRAELHRLSHQAAVDGALRSPLLGRLAWAQQFVAASRAAKLRRLFGAIRFVP
ncbi:Reverse transcriptase (RNA-dependent DNA polymerase) [Roseateles sp. YR242]|uniref:reverse transcriptase family protein n=1 Tax=Roseateles sp. YR242 TaxID=1855305 RepID=UPI0008C3D622|nr:reverse transcriptase family protein [Roseateles sp. YR242]SEK61669.1 Reverse transcriptase (RNA-dependent DNA polymerase) [Roseateles sp. YR242]